jgi:hypothetical protein
VEAIAAFLSGSRLSATPIPLLWNDFLSSKRRASFDYDVWLPLANEHGVRRAMQNNVPPLMIHASTSRNWGVNHGRHIPRRDDCLVDRFPEQVAIPLVCSTGQVATQQGVVDAALPFASLFAGLLITADLVRAQLPGFPQVPNFALLDMHGALDMVQTWDRRPRQGCVCREQAALHEKFNGATKHSALFLGH